MADLDLLHFEQLKQEVQAEYLKNHHPSFDDISKWKGIDIIYFQEDLRRKAKGNISEKSFYTYFKSNPTTKLPRIDMLNLLSMYVDYQSWYDFKRKNLFANEIISENDNSAENEVEGEEILELVEINNEANVQKTEEKSIENIILQNNNIENQKHIEKSTNEVKKKKNLIFNFYTHFKEFIWLGISAILLAMVLVLIFWQRIFATEYSFTFIDADRNTKITDEIEKDVRKLEKDIKKQ